MSPRQGGQEEPSSGTRRRPLAEEERPHERLITDPLDTLASQRSKDSGREGRVHEGRRQEAHPPQTSPKPAKLPHRSALL